MATIKKDFRGMRCPLPGLKVNSMFAANELKSGDILEVVADCPSFEKDVKKVCDAWKKTLIKFFNQGQLQTATIKC